MARIMMSKPDAELLGQTEYEIRDRAHRLAAKTLETALNERKKGVPRVEYDLPSLPGIGPSARFVKYRPKTFMSLVGDIRLDRAYSHCKQCGQGHFVWDQTLRLADRYTPAAREVVTLAGIKESFGEVFDKSLYKQSGLHLSESTVQRITEEAGERLGELLKQGKVLGKPVDWDWHRDRAGQTCGY